MNDRVRVRGSAIGAQVFGVIFWAFFTLCLALSPFGSRRSLVQAAIIEAGLLYILIRPLFMGVWVSQSQLLIRSWFWRYKISASDIQWVSWKPYSGMMNRYHHSPLLDPLYSYMGMMVVRYGSRKPQHFQGTLATRRVVERIVEDVHRATGAPVLDLGRRRDLV